MRGMALLLAIVLAVSWTTAVIQMPEARGYVSAGAAPHLIPPDPAVQGWPPHVRQGAPLPPPSPMQTSGIARLLVLLIEFQDLAASPAHDANYFDGTLNAQGPSVRSLRSYYQEVSLGRLTVNATIVPTWWRSGETMAHYGQDSGSGVDDANGPIYALVTEAVQAADPSFNFAPFDTDNDGVIDHLLVVHAGAGQENTAGNPDLIWSHRWAVLDANSSVPGSQPLTADGVQVYGYIMTSEDSPIGVVTHEFGHDLGLPDLYDTDPSSFGVGVWDVMGTGSWNGFPSGSAPAYMSAWSRSRLGWVIPTVVTSPLVSTSIPDVETTGTVYRLSIRSGFSGDEYFLVENRQPVGFDDALPGFGLLIWHVDDSIAENDNDLHRLVDLLEADETTTDDDHPIDAGDPWRDTATGFGPDTTPSSDAYSGDSTGWRVRDISASGDPMIATIARTIGRDLAVSEIRLPHHAAVGESVVAQTILRNEGVGAENVSLAVRVYRDRVQASSLVLERTFSLAGLAAGGAADFNVTFMPDRVGRFLVNAVVALTVDEIPSNNERIAHVLANAFAFRDAIESSPTQWTLDGTDQDLHRWRIIDESQENGSAHSPTRAWKFGYVPTLVPNPLPPAWHTLTSPMVNLPGGPTHLIFYQRYDLWGRTETPLLINLTETDHGYVEVRYLQGSWTAWMTLSEYTARDLTWRGVSFNLTAAAVGASALQVRFNVSSNVMPSAGGWWIDDVMIAAIGLGRAVVVTGPESPVETPIVAEFSIAVKIFNVGEVEDTFVLSAMPPTGWNVSVRTGATVTSANGFRVHLAPDRDLALTLAIRMGSAVAIGQTYTTTIGATSEADTNATDTTDVGVTVTEGGSPFDVFARSPVLWIVVAALVAVMLIVVVLARRRRRVPPPL